MRNCLQVIVVYVLVMSPMIISCGLLTDWGISAFIFFLIIPLITLFFVGLARS